jgi:LCP family protein required for cell wall assembly
MDIVRKKPNINHPQKKSFSQKRSFGDIRPAAKPRLLQRQTTRPAQPVRRPATGLNKSPQTPIRPIPRPKKRPATPARKDPASPLFYKKKHGQGIIKKTFKIFFFSLLLIFFVVLFFGAYEFYKIHNANQKITVDNNISITDSAKLITSTFNNSKRAELKGEKNGRINMLLLGIAGEGKPGTNLTDTIMIASINTKTNKVALMSLPRDLYVNIADSASSSKINSIYQIGINQNKNAEPLIKTIEKMIGDQIHYYTVLNFDGFESIIDDIGGITITNERDIYDPKYPGPNYSYELFELKKGTHVLDGPTALKYARQRHGDPEGDFGRAKRQQQVLQAVKTKVFSKKTLFNVLRLNKIIKTLENNLKTNMTLKEMESLYFLTQELDTHNITNTVVDAWKKDSILRVSHLYFENGRMFILVPRVGNFSEIQEMSKNIFDLNALKKRKAEIKKESANVGIINYTQLTRVPRQIQTTLKELGFNNVSIAKNLSLSSLSSETTMAIDKSLGQKPFSLDEIIKKIPATNSNLSELEKIKITQEDLNKYDIIIIIGNDLEELYNYDSRPLEEMNESEYEKIYKDLINVN